MGTQVLGTRNFTEALDRLGNADTRLESRQYGALLKECANAKDITQGRQVHAHIDRNGGYERDTFVGNYLVHMYGKCGRLDEARRVFDCIRFRNVFSCNIMMVAFAENGHLQEARVLFDKTDCKNLVTWNAMIDVYVKKQKMKQAKDLFETMPERNVVSWTSMIEGYAQNGQCRRALRMFKLMDLDGVKPNSVTYILVLEACADMEAFSDGTMVHGFIRDDGLEPDMKVANTLIHMYGCCRKVEVAKCIFDSMLQKSTVSWNSIVVAYAQNRHVHEAKGMFDNTPVRDTVSWNAMIAAYAQNGHSNKALELFQVMDSKPDKITYVTVIDACASLAALEDGKMVQTRAAADGCHTDLNVANALLNLYSKCACLHEAKGVYDSMQTRDAVSYTAMMTVYTQTGHSKYALLVLQEMDLEGVKPDNFTYVTAIDACKMESSLERGRWIHSRAVAEGYSWDKLLENALMNLLGRCGKLNDAKEIFEGIKNKDLVSMNSMISMYAANGEGRKAIEFFLRMVLEGVQPDGITFSCVLSACSHSGLFKLAWRCFPQIFGDYGVVPEMDHYVFMVDLIARAGMAEEALDLINNMPFEPPNVVWTILLDAHKKHGSKGTGAVERVINLEPMNATPYIFLSNHG